MCIINIHAYNRPEVHTVFWAHTYIQQKHCICYQAAIWLRVQCNWAVIYQWVGCKGSLCANGWGRNTMTLSSCQWLPLQAQSAKVRVQGAKVRTCISASWKGMQQQHATPTTTITDQLTISTGAGGVNDAAIIATCIRAHNSNHASMPLHKLQWLLHRA